MNLKSKPYIVENGQQIAEFNDLSKDDQMANVQRGELVNFAAVGSEAIDGVYEWLAQEIAIVVCAGSVYKVESDSTVTKLSGATLNTGTPVVFDDFGTTLYMANGGKIVTCDGSTCSYVSDGDAPTSVTHVAFLDGYLGALTADSQQIDHSDVRDPDTWLGEFFQAEQRPDNAVALHSAWGEFFIPGEQTVENWYDAGSADSPFRRAEGANTELGCLSPYSVELCDNRWFFFSAGRNVVYLEGRSPKIVSSAFDDEFKALDTVSNAIAMNLPADTKYVLTFPTENKTYAYDYKLDTWARWSSWDISNAIRNRWLGNCSCHMEGWNKTLVGGTDGTLYEYVTDGSGVSAETVVSELWTGVLHSGTVERKSPQTLNLVLKGGIGNPSDTEPFLLVYWRDDGKTIWRGPRKIELGQYGETEIVKRLHRVGSYRTRQYRFVFHGARGFTLYDGGEA